LLLLDIDLDPGNAAPLTGVFSPKSYKAGATVDMVVYFHGQHLEDTGTYVPGMTVETYFKAADMSKLLTQVNDATNGTNPRNLLFVAPTLNKSAQAGRLATKGMDWFLKQVLDGCLSDGPHQGQSSAPTLKNLFLACHSGGGKVMLEVAEQATGASKPGGAQQGFGSALQECWGFDCLYDDFPVLDLDALLKPAFSMTAAQAKTAGYDPWSPLPPAPPPPKRKPPQQTLVQTGCETRWRDFAHKSKTPVYMHWFERKIRARNLDLIANWPSGVAPEVTVDANFYDNVVGGIPTPVTTPPVTLAASHNTVPNSYLPKRLTAMKLV
jgi:hypothetical protein